MPDFALVPPLYEDQDILVYAKPSGLAVIPERWEEEAQNLLEMLRTIHPEIANLHRIDKDASGLVAFVKNPSAAPAYHRLFETGGFVKIYHVILGARPTWTEMTCDAALLPDGDRQHRTVCVSKGKPSRSDFRIIESYRDFALAEVRIFSGRTHQIRAHAQFLGFPLIGDTLYGGKPDLKLSMIKRGWKGDELEEGALISRCALHARSLSWSDAASGEKHQAEAPYPKDFATALKQLRKWN